MEEISQGFNKKCLYDESSPTSSLRLPKLSLSQALLAMSSNTVMIKDEVFDEGLEFKSFENCSKKNFLKEESDLRQCLKQEIDNDQFKSETFEQSIDIECEFESIAIKSETFLKEESDEASNNTSDKEEMQRVSETKILLNHNGITDLKKIDYDHLVEVEQRSTSKRNLRKYPSIIKNQNLHFNCNFCHKNFRFKQNLEHHQCINGILCDICQKKFATRTALKNHYRLVHVNKLENLKKYICHICDKHFYYKYLLVSHIKILHQETKTVDCNICFRVFSSRQNLFIHMKDVHKDKNDIFCDVCGKMFNRLLALNSHVMLEHKKVEKNIEEERNFTIKFSNPQICKLKTKKYSCTFCSKLFINEDYMKKHIESAHRIIQGLTCTYCGKKFSSKSHCKEHVKCVHKGIKDYVCTLCYQAFGREGHLNRHIMTVHNKRSIT